MSQLLLELALCRDVGCNTCKPDHLSSRISDRKTSVADPCDLPIRATDPIDLVVATLVSVSQTYGRLDACPIIFMDGVEETVRFPIHAFERSAKDLLIPRTDVQGL